MALLLGIDTGGTFTDAVLVDDASGAKEQVIATAKAPTTHHDLAVGVGHALTAVLGAVDGVAAADVDLVSVSTTLATNALVEGHGQPAALLAFGFSSTDLGRAGIGEVVAPEHLVTFGGGHDAHGSESEPFPAAEVADAIERLAPEVAAIAVTARFSVRNPAHERAAFELVRKQSRLPVTMSHELSARLHGPRRALTTALNARLLATISRLNDAVAVVLAEVGIDAPLMVVRGDGSLVTADFAAARPIETILSGPAASVVGAVHLAGVDRGVVADIGGTTTDVAVLDDARPRITAEGAVVGGHPTMVEAVDMATIGLGGDSEVRIDTRHDHGPILLGPERAIPIGRLALTWPQVVVELERQHSAPVGLTSHGRFLVAVAEQASSPDRREQGVLDRLRDGPVTESVAAPSGLDARAAQRLRAKGLVRVATLTPTDAHAVLEGIEGIDRAASQLVADVLARQTSPSGGTIAEAGIGLARQVLDRLIRQSAAFVLQVGLERDGIAASSATGLIEAALGHHRGVVDMGIRLDHPVVGIGAPAQSWYPSVASMLRTEGLIPPHADVANAVGAVVGRVRVRRTCTITQPTKGQFRVHLDEQPTFGSVDNARAEARDRLEAAVRGDADQAGAATPDLRESWQARVAMVDGKEVFVEGTVTVEASGRPRW